MFILDRRSALCVLAISLCGSGADAGSELGDGVTDKFAPSDPAAARKWMDQWMFGQKRSSGALHVGRFADPIYFLLKPISWSPDPKDAAIKPVKVPVGFVTDFASIPQTFWSFLRPDGLYTFPAIVHDYLYWTQSVSREVADQIFRLGMEEFGVPNKVVSAIYRSVSLFGGSAWDSNRNLREAGESRILKRFPDDPKVKWATWKANPEVFE